MNAPHTAATIRDISFITGAHRTTLDAIFHHPTTHNLEWNNVVALISEIGGAHETSNNEFMFEAAGKRQIVHKPHTKDLTGSEVLEVRRFLTEAGFSPGHPSQPAAHPEQAPPYLVIVVDHHGTKIFHVDITSDDMSKHVIRPYDPHHFLHHLTHKDQSRERGQRAPEEPAYYEKIAQAVAEGGKILVVGHGSGKSNAAHHLTEYLRTHHRETYQRIVHEMEADLSAVTEPQLLAMARNALST